MSGHVCRKVQQKISSSSFPNKDMILFIVDLSGDEFGHGGMFNGTEAWIDAIDRGGLWHVNNGTYYAILSCTFESILPCHLQMIRKRTRTKRN